MGFIIGLSWINIVIKLILRKENFLTKIIKYFLIVNNITDDLKDIQDFTRDGKIKKEIENLEEKAKYLEELKEKIKTFRENIDKLEVLNENNTNEEEEDYEEESELDEEELYIKKILAKGKDNLTQNDIFELNKYFEKVKKNQ